MEHVRMLYLEDNPLDVDLLRAFLEKEKLNFELVHALDQHEYVHALDTGAFDLILSDFKLPGYDGLTALHLTRERYPDIPFILISGTLGEDKAIESLKAGATDYVLKQNMSRLVPAIQRAFKEAEIQREHKRTQLALLNTSKRNEAILSAVPDIIMEVDNNKVYTWANTAGFKFFGDDVIGHEASEYFLGEQKTYDMVRSVFNGTGEVVYVESWQRRIDGEARLLAWWCRSLTDQQGQVIGALSSARDVTELRQAEEQIKKDLKEKNLLLKEVHHRVKNNLQIIISLLNLQIHQIKDPNTLNVIIDSKNRIHSMALVHEKLYESNDFTSIDFNTYVNRITRELSHVLGVTGKIEFDIEIQQGELGIDQAIPCGLIINELVTNAMKHAFPGERKGKIMIRFSRSAGGECKLCVADDGVGSQNDLRIDKLSTLGLQLVKILTQQLNGDLVIDQSDGMSFTILFNVND